MNAETIIEELKKYSHEEYAAHHLRFFKTGKGQYGEGDKFFGLKVPDVRRIAKSHHKAVKLNEVKKLIENPYHEIRLAGLLILVYKYPKSSFEEQKDIYELYLNSVNYINNWDLVDVSAYHIIGPHLYGKDTQKLWELAKSNHLWSERISILSTLYFIKRGHFDETLELAEHFLDHKHDLMHKAAGWMLREIGKKDIEPLYCFLDKHHKIMPRTMLRYAIEKLSKEKRKFYMAK